MARLNGLRYFLTYAQSNDEQFTAVRLADILFALEPDFVEVAREFHQDDGIHFHAVICFPTRRQQSMAYFDVTIGGVTRHPNIRPIRNAGKDLYYRRHYLRKEDKDKHDTSHKDAPCDYTGEPEFRGTRPPYSTAETGERYTWGDALESCSTRAEFMLAIRTNFPKDYILRQDALQSFAASHYTNPQAPVPTRNRADFVVPPEMDAWVEEVLGQVRLVHTNLFFLCSLGIYLFQFHYPRW